MRKILCIGALALAGFGLGDPYDLPALTVDDDAADPTILAPIEVEGAVATTPTRFIRDSSFAMTIVLPRRGRGRRGTLSGTLTG